MNEITIRPAPQEMHDYLVKLAKVVGYTDSVEIAVIAASDMPMRVGVTDDPHGFLRITPGKAPLIILSDDVPEDRWQSLISHEFLHILRWTLDEFVLNHLAFDQHDTYFRLVEDTMKPLSILLIIGGMLNAEWIDEEPKL